MKKDNISQIHIISFLKIAISVAVLLVIFGTLDIPIHAMENADGSHSYYVMSLEDSRMDSCVTETTTSEHPFSSQQLLLRSESKVSLFSPLNYSQSH